MVTSPLAHGNILKKTKYYFLFLLDSNSSKEQIHFILSNPSKIHLKAIIEVSHNLLENPHLKLTTSLKKDLSKNKRILLKLTSSRNKDLSLKRKIIRKNWQIIYQILNKAKSIILLAINQ